MPHVHYEMGECKFGPILVGATGYGLCYVGFNRSHAELFRDLSKRFSWLDCVRGGTDLKRVLVTVEDPEVRYVGELAIHGTDFQKMVWDEIRAISHTHTMTYGQLAEAIGKPKAVRAVGQACGANPLAVVVPCHRVVGKDFIGQYHWGIDVKRQLLEIEQAS